MDYKTDRPRPGLGPDALAEHYRPQVRAYAQAQYKTSSFNSYYYGLNGGLQDEVDARIDAIYRERMQGLPIVNPELSVEAVGFEPFEAHELGVLISPWFMNLVLLPADEALFDELRILRKALADAEGKPP